MRLSVAMAVAWLSISVLSAAEPAQAGIRKSTQIPAQSLGSALQALAKQRALQVVYLSDAVDSLKTEGASGELTSDEALTQLLSGTGLSYRYLDEATVTVFPADAPQAMNGSAEMSDDVGAIEPGKADRKSFWRRLRLAETEAQNSAQSQAENSESASSGASAEDTESTKLEEVVVTAQKREQSMQDIPMSISALSGDMLQRAGVASIEDLSYAVPGLSVAEQMPGYQLITIRGINNVRGGSPLVGVYLDEMPVTAMTSTFASAPDLRVIDLERVEVLKGPQGTLFGEGAAGGAIRFITKDPDLNEFGGEATAQLSNTSDGGWGKSVVGIVNLPVVKDRLAFRIAATYEDNAGWIDQPEIGREDINDSEVEHIRLKALLSPTEGLDIKGLVEVHRNDGGGSNIVNIGPRSHSNFKQPVDSSDPTSYFDDYELYNLTATYDLGFAELLSSTSHGDFETNTRDVQVTFEDPPFLEVLARADNFRRASLSAQELRLTSAGNTRLEWTFGGSYKKSALADHSVSGLAAIVHALDPLVEAGEVESNLLEGLSANTTPTNKSKSWAIFGDASFELADGFEIGGGLRYFSDKRRAFDPLTPAIGPASGTFDKLTYRAFAKYELSGATNLYASVGTGFRSGGFNPGAAIALGAASSYEPEMTTFYELGVKTGSSDGRVRAGAAAFYGKYKDMLEDISTTSPVDGETILQYTSNGQDSRIRGVEWNLEWRVVDGLLLGFAGDVIDTDITFVDPINSNPTYFVGDEVNNVAQYTLAATLRYGFDWTASMPGFFETSYNRKGKSYATNRNRFGGIILDDQVVGPPVDFFNVNVGAEWAGWAVNLFGRNLLDEDGPVMVGVTGQFAQARPRTFGVGFNKSF